MPKNKDYLMALHLIFAMHSKPLWEIDGGAKRRKGEGATGQAPT
ncbi:hypothetical protein BOO71_0006214 [Deinococcus marmoris]|uniref:Uncharacterized protein n=1 Tax=Deinococcus marmoris TaxID=249408 RepID=A0A1U7NZN0_9DEIO|nr:hypothetical protein BOO71_0006214 [Deinococcus marmoris]